MIVTEARGDIVRYVYRSRTCEHGTWCSVFVIENATTVIENSKVTSKIAHHLDFFCLDHDQ